MITFEYNIGQKIAILRLNRLSLGQISELFRPRNSESYCNVELKWPDTGQHTAQVPKYGYSELERI